MRDQVQAQSDGLRQLLIIDDHRLVREAISTYLEEHGPFSVRVASDLKTGLAALSESEGYDAVLLDIVMPGMNGLAGVSEVIASASPAPVVIFSGNVNEDFVGRALEIGAKGYIPKSFPLRSLSNAINLVTSGERFVPADFMIEAAQQDKAGVHGLLPKEIQVLHLIADGKTNKEIAWQLNCSEAAVKMHVRSTCQKLGANNRAHAVVLAKRHNLI